MTELGTLYDKTFFDTQWEGSLRSARVLLGALAEVWTPSSVADVGCGRGAWLAAASELGAKRLVGIDGPWASKDGLLLPTIEFHGVDLDSAFRIDERFDLAMSLEVAEHINPDSSHNFAQAIMRLSDAVVFSAAFIGQPGVNHINTRPHSFWALQFLEAGYRLFDVFRPTFWQDDRVEPWYRQNTFLYVKPAHPLHAAMQAAGAMPAVDARFVDCVHPLFYLSALEELVRLKSGGTAPAPVPVPETSSQRPAEPVRRNDPCPCGSGKRYKHCHGRF